MLTYDVVCEGMENDMVILGALVIPPDIEESNEEAEESKTLTGIFCGVRVPAGLRSEEDPVIR